MARGIVLATADGLGTVAVMRRTGKSKPCVWRWQERYVAEGVEGLLRDKTRPSRKKPLTAEIKLKVLTKTANETPANATHWSVRSMAKEIGISHTSVQRIWAEAGLKPHLIRKFKLSNDLLQEPDEFFGAMAWQAFADDGAGLHVERGEQRRCAVTLIVVRHCGRTALLYR